MRGQGLALEIGGRQSRDGDQAVKRPQARAHRGDERFFLGRRVRCGFYDTVTLSRCGRAGELD